MVRILGFILLVTWGHSESFLTEMDLHRKSCIENILGNPTKTNNPNYQLTRAISIIKAKDADSIPKVPFAGNIFVEGGVEYQLMHNGVKVIKDCYYDSPWITDVIYALKGHHEPREELLFYEILKTIPANSTMIELGSYWGYYSLWFATDVLGAKNYLVEPDLMRLNVGRKNFELNGKSAVFEHGYAAICDNDLVNYSGARAISIDEYLDEKNIEHLAILHSDIQGAEYAMLKTCVKSIENNRIDWLFISTHQYDIHDRCLRFLIDLGCKIHIEFKGEIGIGDGLIIASKVKELKCL